MTDLELSPVDESAPPTLSALPQNLSSAANDNAEESGSPHTVNPPSPQSASPSAEHLRPTAAMADPKLSPADESAPPTLSLPPQNQSSVGDDKAIESGSSHTVSPASPPSAVPLLSSLSAASIHPALPAASLSDPEKSSPELSTRPRTDDDLVGDSAASALDKEAATATASDKEAAAATASDKEIARDMASVDKDAKSDVGATAGAATSGLLATRSHASGAPMEPSRTREDGVDYPTGLNLFLISLALCLAVLLVALDNSIIATAIPKITDRFNSLADVGWYGSAYLLTTASLQLLFGKFYTFFNIKWVFLIAIAIFELGSIICGVAQNSVTLIIGRAIAGAGSAGVFSGALLILTLTVAIEKRPAYTGMVGSMYGIASVAGPLLGGVFTDKATWRLCFLINVPIGFVTILIIIFTFPPPPPAIVKDEPWAKRIKYFDPVGTILFIPAIVCLLLALQWGGTKDPWNSGKIIALFVVFGVLIIAFVIAQIYYGENSTVPPRIFLQRTVWSSTFYAFCVGAAFLTSVYFLPLWFQAVKGASAVRSGIMNLPMLISTALLSVVAGILVTLIGYYTPFILLSVVAMSVGYGLLSTLKPDTGSGKWIGYQILAGAGVGMGLQMPLSATQVVLDLKDVPIGTSIVVFGQILGGALFVGVGQNTFQNGLVKYLRRYAPSVNPMTVLNVGATDLKALNISKAVLSAVKHAYSDALTQTLLVSAIIGALSILGAVFVEHRSVKGKKLQMAAA